MHRGARGTYDKYEKGAARGRALLQSNDGLYQGFISTFRPA